MNSVNELILQCVNTVGQQAEHSVTCKNLRKFKKNLLVCPLILQCFDAVSWVRGRATVNTIYLGFTWKMATRTIGVCMTQ